MILYAICWGSLEMLNLYNVIWFKGYNLWRDWKDEWYFNYTGSKKLKSKNL